MVEDNDQVRAFALNMLLDEGCSVTEASNAQEALTRLEEAPVDLMLTDVVMPGASGIELANQVRRTRPELPIVLVSGYSDELVGTGTDYPFLTKPFTSAELKSVLSAALAETKSAVEASPLRKRGVLQLIVAESGARVRDRMIMKLPMTISPQSKS